MRREAAWRDISVVINTAKDLTTEKSHGLIGERKGHTSVRVVGTSRDDCTRQGNERLTPTHKGCSIAVQSRFPNTGEGHTHDPVVEDNELNRDMLSRRLVRKGYDVLIAEDAPED
jgi:hypothetical protein